MTDTSDADALALLLGSAAASTDGADAQDDDEDEFTLGGGADDGDDTLESGDADEGLDAEPDELGDDADTAMYSDDDLLEVTVDGERQEVSIADLKRRFAGEGAIEKRLQEATELRKAAQAEREAATQEVEQHRAKMLQTVQQLDQFLFMPLVQKPDPALRATRMNEYLMQKEAYDDDQQRIAQLRNVVSVALTQQQQQQVQSRERARAKEAELLLQREPSLSEQEGVAAFQADIAVAVKHYGFTQAQIGAVDSHALFLMARDAGRYLKMTQKGQGSGLPTNRDNANTKRVTRLLKPGTVVQQRPAAQAAKVRKAAEARASKTGSVDDVAAMLVASVTNPKQKRN